VACFFVLTWGVRAKVIMDPESPSFHRFQKSVIMRPKEEFTDLKYWKTALPPIDTENDKANSISNLSKNENDNIGINGTVRRIAPAVAATTSIDDVECLPKEPVNPPEIPVKIESVTQNDFRALAFVQATPPSLHRSISSEFVRLEREKQAEESGPKQTLISINVPRRPQQIIVLTAKPATSVPKPATTSVAKVSPNAMEGKHRENILQNGIVAQHRSLPPKKEVTSTSFTDLESQALQAQKLISSSTLDSLPKERHDLKEIDDGDYAESQQQQRNIFRWAQLLRAFAMTTHTWITVWPGLDDPRVAYLNGKGLLIAILVFTALDVLM
jgi:hypothetical protein